MVLFLMCINMAECKPSKLLKYFLTEWLHLNYPYIFVLYLGGLFSALQQLFCVTSIKYKWMLTVWFLVTITRSRVVAFICFF